MIKRQLCSVPYFSLSQDWQRPKTWLLFMPVWVDALLATARTL